MSALPLLLSAAQSRRGIREIFTVLVEAGSNLSDSTFLPICATKPTPPAKWLPIR